MFSKIKRKDLSLRALPLCITLCATALVIQDAFVLRANTIKDDEMNYSILNYISSGAGIVLAVAWILSLVILLSSFGDRKE